MISPPRIASGPTIKIIDRFPNPIALKYDEDLWHKQHNKSLVVINCKSTNIYFPQHWTPLSIKCAFGGKEFYHFKNNSYAVCDENFLILNEGARYSSSIQSIRPTESFTLNFTKENLEEVFSGVSIQPPKQLDNPFDIGNKSPGFVEKLYPHNKFLSRPLFKMRKLIANKKMDTMLYIQLFYEVLENMILLYNKTSLEIDSIKAKGKSTREELFKRLNRAKDYMDSCYNEEISLHRLSGICFLNPYYFLRQFKINFNITPHQYLTRRRLIEAEQLLLKTNSSISDLTCLVGFQDLSSFSRMFKKHYGSSPENFRKNRNERYD